MPRISGTKPDATGRASGKVVGRKGAALKPPKGEPWVWHTRELQSSDAWRMRSITCIRLLTFLEIEYMNHAGTENGNLMATHDQLEEWGLSRRLIRGAVEEAVFLGLLRAVKGGRWVGSNQPSIYRLTYLPDRYGNPATNEWRSVTSEEIKTWRLEGSKTRKARKARRKKQVVSSPSSTSVVPLRQLPTPISGGC